GIRENRLQVRGVHAGDDITVIVDLREEPAEGIPQVLERAVNVEVVRLYVGHDGDMRPVAQERCVELVCLYNEVVAVAGRGVSAEIDALAGQHVGWAESCPIEHPGNQGSGCRLAVAASPVYSSLGVNSPRIHRRSRECHVYVTESLDL